MPIRVIEWSQSYSEGLSSSYISPEYPYRTVFNNVVQINVKLAVRYPGDGNNLSEEEQFLLHQIGKAPQRSEAIGSEGSLRELVEVIRDGLQARRERIAQIDEELLSEELRKQWEASKTRKPIF